MSFPRYERYKDSGPTWFGRLPEHWQVFSGRRVFAQKQEASLFNDPQLSATQKYGVIPQALFMELEGQKVVLALKGTDAFKHVEIDDFIISLRSFQGGIEKSHYRGCVSTAYTVLRNAKEIDAGYWEYLFKSSAYIDALSSVTDGIREGRSISYAQFGSIPLPLPSLPEQTAIARFLDYETLEIDALIEEQRRLIELLKEKRLAVILHAVTKGLNSDVPMKDSGIEWMGHIPAHWTVMSLGRIATSACDGPFGSGLKSDHYTDAGVRVIRLQNIRDGNFDGADAVFIDPIHYANLGDHDVQGGDLLIAGLGDDRHAVGRACVAPPKIEPAMVKADCFRFRLTSEVVPEFIAAQLSIGAPTDAGRLATGSTRSRIPVSKMSSRAIAIPCRAEQSAIVDYLRRREEEFARLRCQAALGIELLQERRSALISAAVTGKIDVRTYTAKPAMSATQYSSGFAHQLLAAEILDRCNGQRMGRIKLQKLIHLCEYHGQISEVQGDYARKAAGPFDAKAMAGISKNLKKQKWFEEVKEGERYVYRPLEKHGEHKKYLAHWQAQMPRINEVLNLLGNFKTRECEIVSTLYAAWNDLLIDSGSTDDAAILHEASSAERWHKSKEQIAPERWKKALQWMKDKGLVPVGYGKHTRHTAGQIGTTTEVAHEPA